MKRALIFAKRNLKEILRDPLSLIFNFAFPILLLTLFFCFTWGKNTDTILQQTPMFAPNKIVPAMAIFGFSFLTLFVGMLIAKDRSTSFIDRLRTSPMKSLDFYLGYLIPMLLIALTQILLIYFIGWIYSLGFESSIRFNLLTFNSFISGFMNIPIAIFFISLGIFFGSFINEKAIGGVASLSVNLVAITSGMFMPLHMMGFFKSVCQSLPFYHAVTLAQDSYNGDWPNSVSFYDELVEYYQHFNIDYNMNIFDTWWMHLILISIYTIIAIGLSLWMLKKNMMSEK